MAHESSTKRVMHRARTVPEPPLGWWPRTQTHLERVDGLLVLAVAGLLVLGLIMVTSASIGIAERNLSSPFYFLQRQLIYVVLGLGTALVVYQLSLQQWEKITYLLVLALLVLLVVVLLPGIGKNVKGATRWLSLGPFNLQVSEIAKLVVVIYVASYMVRCKEALQKTWFGFFKPLIILGLLAVLLLQQPDFGAAVVLMAIGLGMLFLGGAKWLPFGLLVGSVSAMMAFLAYSSPYRLARLTSFMDPWTDPYNTGFQLTQSLIAIGSGSWFGVGLGGSVQKLFYLPEAHNDFLFAVLAEELGLVGIVVVIALYSLLVWRAFVIGAMAEQIRDDFGAYLSYGIAIWFALQAFINIGVNMALLPTKGLTLPLMSYGGSSMLVSCAAMGLLLRVHYETQLGLIRRQRRLARSAFTELQFK